MSIHINKLYGKVKKKAAAAWTASSLTNRGPVFPQDLIIHVTYHKCLSLYYRRIMQVLTAEFPFVWVNYLGDSERFNKAAVEGTGKRIQSLTDRDDIAWDSLPSYRGSHFIRDPREMIVSGYRYHLWATEAWCRADDFPWRHYVIRRFFDLVEPDPAKYPTNISYQSYLQSLDLERGMILEMIFRRDAFDQIGRWNYQNPNVIELRYEQVVGNEPEAFRQLFEHYRFSRPLRERGVELANELRLANLEKGEQKHVRNGQLKQWQNEMPPRVREVFKQGHGPLLVQLGYERDLNW